MILYMIKYRMEFPGSNGEGSFFRGCFFAATDLTIPTPDCENTVNGIVCDSDLTVIRQATVTAINGAATKYSAALRALQRRN